MRQLHCRTLQINTLQIYISPPKLPPLLIWFSRYFFRIFIRSLLGYYYVIIM